MIDQDITSRAAALDIIHRIAIKHGLTTVTAESLTCGLVAAALAMKSGCSAYHQGGIAAYNIDMKVDILGVDRALAEECNCVSNAVAQQMADGASRISGADCVIATTGYAEPWPEGGIDKPYAHYVVLCGKAAANGSILLEGKDRTAARNAVATKTLCVLAAMMRAAYEG